MYKKTKNWRCIFLWILPVVSHRSSQTIIDSSMTQPYSQTFTLLISHVGSHTDIITSKHKLKKVVSATDNWVFLLRPSLECYANANANEAYQDTVIVQVSQHSSSHVFNMSVPQPPPPPHGCVCSKEQTGLLASCLYGEGWVNLENSAAPQWNSFLCRASQYHFTVNFLYPAMTMYFILRFFPCASIFWQCLINLTLKAILSFMWKEIVKKKKSSLCKNKAKIQKHN